MTDTVFNIIDELQRVDAMLTASEGELTEEIEAALDAVEGKVFDKARKIGQYILELQAMQAVADAELKRVQEIKRIRANKVARMKKWLHLLLERSGLDKVETPTVTVGIYNNTRPSISWTGDEGEIPESFKRVKVELDGTAAYEYWKKHKKLPTGFTVDLGTHLRIK